MSALAFALALTACDGNINDNSYTFKFRVENNTISKTISTIEFINGSNKDNRVLRKVSGLKLTKGELSDEYKVSGFTGEYGTNERFCGVIVTYDNETSNFGYSHFEHESKILVAVGTAWSDSISFSSGKW
ncbi:MAG: hypothetical protein LBS82_04235 [Spirochaetaceae bacterium]|nr:hypothetical protein [Spirochaetaceae bacterium]